MLNASMVLASESHSASHWGYAGEVGPNRWGQMSDEFKTCGVGTRQSPIDVTVKQAIKANMNDLKFSYQSVTPEIVNNGHTVQVNYAPGSHVSIDGKDFQLLQFHFHTPSENKLAGKSFPMEMHLVHKSADGKLAVVAVFFEPGSKNPILQSAAENLPVHAGQQETLSNVQLNAINLLPKNKKFARFNGSLTTPPCSEGVSWVVMTTPVQLSKQQLAKFKSVLGDNARPIQPLNNRFILAEH